MFASLASLQLLTRWSHDQSKLKMVMWLISIRGVICDLSDAYNVFSGSAPSTTAKT